jgi:polyisoprenoid-binding protein YceI
MKKTFGIILGIVVAASTVFAADSKGEKKAFEIDKKASKVHWTGKKVTGEHTGYVSISDGEVHLKDGKVAGADVKIDLNSIVCTDLTNEEWNKKLVDHLKSDDFFSVDKYPMASFQITDVKTDNNGDHTVTGKLTMKGATHEINFPAEMNMENGVLSAKGTAKIDRTKWNIRYGSGKFFQDLGDRMIDDEFEITFDIVTLPDNQVVTAD